MNRTSRTHDFILENELNIFKPIQLINFENIFENKLHNETNLNIGLINNSLLEIKNSNLAQIKIQNKLQEIQSIIGQLNGNYFNSINLTNKISFSLNTSRENIDISNKWQESFEFYFNNYKDFIEKHLETNFSDCNQTNFTKTKNENFNRENNFLPENYQNSPYIMNLENSFIFDDQKKYNDFTKCYNLFKFGADSATNENHYHSIGSNLTANESNNSEKLTSNKNGNNTQIFNNKINEAKLTGKDNCEVSKQNKKIMKIIEELYPKRSIGFFSWEKRVNMILKFKLKKFNKRNSRPILTKYSGRSKVASRKLRFKGRFIKNPIENLKKNIFNIKKVIIN